MYKQIIIRLLGNLISWIQQEQTLLVLLVRMTNASCQFGRVEWCSWLIWGPSCGVIYLLLKQEVVMNTMVRRRRRSRRRVIPVESVCFPAESWRVKLSWNQNPVWRREKLFPPAQKIWERPCRVPSPAFPPVSAWDNLYIKRLCVRVCVSGGGVEKWPFPSLGGRGSPLPKWAESPRRRNLNEELDPPSFPPRPLPSLLPPYYPPPPLPHLLISWCSRLLHWLIQGLHFMIMNFTVRGSAPPAHPLRYITSSSSSSYYFSSSFSSSSTPLLLYKQ